MSGRASDSAPVRRVSPEILAGIAAGAVSGVAGGLLFATLHAFIIVPIWNRMTGGLIFGAIAGAGAGAAFAACYPEAVRARTTHNVVIGARFGALLWLSIAPVTAADALLRATGLAPRYELLAVAVAVILALVGGATLAWLISHRIHATVAGAAAGLLLVIAMAGPVPVGRSARAFNIFLAAFPAALLGGIALALISPSIFAQIARSGARGKHEPDA